MLVGSVIYTLNNINLSLSQCLRLTAQTPMDHIQPYQTAQAWRRAQDEYAILRKLVGGLCEGK